MIYKGFGKMFIDLGIKIAHDTKHTRQNVLGNSKDETETFEKNIWNKL